MTNRERVVESGLAHKVDQQGALDTVATAQLERNKAEHELDLTIKRKHAETCVFELTERAKAVSPQLVEVLQRLGDEAVLAQIAESMAPLSILGGKTVLEVLTGLLGENNPIGDTLTKLTAGYAAGRLTS